MPNTVSMQAADATVYGADGKPILAYVNPRCKATQTTPRFDLLQDAKEPLAIDIEFQECKHKDWEKWHHRLGRVAIVNTEGRTIYDTFVRYEDFEDGEDLSMKVNPRFGVTWKDLRLENGAQPIHEVSANLKKILHGRTIVGHGMRLDIKAIGEDVWQEIDVTVDTQDLYDRAALNTLVYRHLPRLDFTWHDPTCDAKATMMLYLRRIPYSKQVDPKDNFVVNDEDFPPLGA